MTDTTNTKALIERITRQSEQHTADLRVLTELSIHQMVRQGDIYIQRVADTYGRGERTEDRQLAPGNTKGSRHVVEGAVVYRPTEEQGRDPMHGPVVVADAPWRVTHPEHCDYELPAGTYRVGYQMDPRTRERVMD